MSIFRAMKIFGLACVLAAAGAVFATHAQKSDLKKSDDEISEKTVDMLKSMAWQSLPSKITFPDKRVVEIDKNNPKAVVIPDADAVDIIKAGYLTARAHRCDLQELVIANRDALMRKEKAKKKWTEAQLHYINTLHLYTVQILVGKVEVKEQSAEKPAAPAKDGKPAAAPAPQKPAPAQPATVQCNDKEKQDILAAVEANEKAAGKS